MYPGDAELLLRALFAVFKKHPFEAYGFSVFILFVILFAWIIQAKTPDDLVFPLFVLAFVLIVLIGRFIKTIRQKSVQDFQDPQGTLQEQENPSPQTFEYIQSQPIVLEKLPDQDIPYPQTFEQFPSQEIIEEDLTEKETTQLPPKAHLWEPVSILDKALAIFIGVTSSLMGYSLAYLLFSEKLIRLFSSGTDDEFVRGVIGDVVFQILCGLPVPILAGLAITALSAPFFLKYPSPNRYVLLFLIGFTASFIVYFPYQFFMLFASAF